ncbi:NlpC/P60 family protein [Mycobacterium sp. TNTM28]|uniref:NlpC/P60 family protein n=1 Tax=[Mycobacterium] fortunisiensis TaxID=2600579 RepID=A0ABS6KK27_9MYCO|nr:C40 family peptidase [[Mycobacterium] fortunisiensis]MBU9763938.1 NlpC/P60 family protein [[Mycobacterium] fortunisiensis]
MPTRSVAVLAAPLYELRDLVGPGWTAPGPTAGLDHAHAALSDIAAALGRSWERAAAGWSGAGAGAAAGFTADTATTAIGLADDAQRLSSAAQAAGAAVARAGARLQAIIDRFEQRAAALAAHLDEPGVAQELQAEAQRATTEAQAVVEELRTELDQQTGAITAPAAGSPSAAGMHPRTAGFSAGSGGLVPASSGSPAAPGLSGLSKLAGLSNLAGLSSLAGGWGEQPEAMVSDAGLRDPGMFGAGVTVQLPDGSTAVAPNAVAADAVRHALTQLGVPYRWGGTAPGVGLDCSGLTQWAYHEAGLDIPRLAQEQDIGKAVSAGSLRPGDLAVWDGHVAMIVGTGTMIEAGDPVKLSPIRTTNAGQGFQGFWRPTV